MLALYPQGSYFDRYYQAHLNNCTQSIDCPDLFHRNKGFFILHLAWKSQVVEQCSPYFVRSNFHLQIYTNDEIEPLIKIYSGGISVQFITIYSPFIKVLIYAVKVLTIISFVFLRFIPIDAFSIYFSNFLPFSYLLACMSPLLLYFISLIIFFVLPI